MAPMVVNTRRHVITRSRPCCRGGNRRIHAMFPVVFVDHDQSGMAPQDSNWQIQRRAHKRTWLPL